MLVSSGQALVVDPGAKTASRVAGVLKELDVELGAILLTHGHADHLWNIASVSRLSPEAPIYLAKPDHFWLDEPGPSVLLGAERDFNAINEPWEPASVQAPPPGLFLDGGDEIIPGLILRALPAPGHSPGCTLFFGSAISPNDHGQGLGFRSDESQDFCFSGDVIFKGSIGRTDLPYSDSEAMQETLRTLCLCVNPDTLMLPGHGESTTWHRELELNPFLPSARKMKE